MAGAAGLARAARRTAERVFLRVRSTTCLATYLAEKRSTRTQRGQRRGSGVCSVVGDSTANGHADLCPGGCECACAWTCEAEAEAEEGSEEEEEEEGEEGEEGFGDGGMESWGRWWTSMARC